MEKKSERYKKKLKDMLVPTSHFLIRLQERLPWMDIDRIKNRILTLLLRLWRSHIHINPLNRNCRITDDVKWVIYVIGYWFELITIMNYPVKTLSDKYYKKINRKHKIQFLKDRWMDIQTFYKLQAKEWLQ